MCFARVAQRSSRARRSPVKHSALNFRFLSWSSKTCGNTSLLKYRWLLWSVDLRLCAEEFSNCSMYSHAVCCVIVVQWLYRSTSFDNNFLWWCRRRHFVGQLSRPSTRFLESRTDTRVPTHPWKYLKVLEFFSPKFKALKVLENRTGAWMSLNFIPQVLESPWIHQIKLCNISISVKQVFCLKQDLLIIVTFCFYQLKLSRNHRNKPRYYMLL